MRDRRVLGGSSDDLDAATSLCGNGALDDGEICDGDALGDETCKSQGLVGDGLACNDACDGLDTSVCLSCGNGAIDSDETCDGDALGDETCSSQGKAGTGLICADSCDGFDSSACSATATLVGGNKFGFCVGECKTTMDMTSAPNVTLIVSDYSDMNVTRTNAGVLTSQGMARLDAAIADLSARTLQSVYGCPDCLDSGASWIDYTPHMQASSHHEYEFLNPAVDMMLVDALLQDLISALSACTGTVDVELSSLCTEA